MDSRDPNCPCTPNKAYAACCRPFHNGPALPETAEQLMRSRFSAFVLGLSDYLVETTHPKNRKPGLKAAIERSMGAVRWRSLTIVSTSNGAMADKIGKVEFIAEFGRGGEIHQHREHSRFRRHRGVWKYLDDRG